MIEEIDLLIGLSMESKESNGSAPVIVEKARVLNARATPKLRKDIIMPIIQSSDPARTLRLKTDDYFRRQQIKRGIH